MTTNYPNPHQPWRDHSLCEAETDGATWHLSRDTEHTTGTRTITTTLQRTNDGASTRAFITVPHDDPWTPDDVEVLAAYLTSLAAQICEKVRATPPRLRHPLSGSGAAAMPVQSMMTRSMVLPIRYQQRGGIMDAPKATLEDIYRQNNDIISHLERLNENLHMIREATYGQTVQEVGRPFEQPKHGAFGAVAESSTQVEQLLSEILAAVSKR